MYYLITLTVDDAWWNKNIARLPPCINVGCDLARGRREIAAIINVDAPGGRSDRVRDLLAKGQAFPIRPTLGPIHIDDAPPYSVWLDADVIIRYAPPTVNLCDIGCGVLEPVGRGRPFTIDFTGENRDT